MVNTATMDGRRRNTDSIFKRLPTYWAMGAICTESTDDVRAADRNESSDGTASAHPATRGAILYAPAATGTSTPGTGGIYKIVYRSLLKMNQSSPTLADSGRQFSKFTKVEVEDLYTAGF